MTLSGQDRPGKFTAKQIQNETQLNYEVNTIILNINLLSFMVRYVGELFSSALFTYLLPP